MSYSQWIEIKVISDNMTMKVSDAKLKCGKFYEHGDKSKEIKIDRINKIEIDSGEFSWICSSGRKGAWKGTEGSFKLKEGNTVIGEFKWNCPYWSNTNTFSWSQEASKEIYFTGLEGGQTASGAIGNVFITCIRL